MFHHRTIFNLWIRQIGLNLEKSLSLTLPSTHRTGDGIELYKYPAQQVKDLNDPRVLRFEILMLFKTTQWEGLEVGLLRTLYKKVL